MAENLFTRKTVAGLHGVGIKSKCQLQPNGYVIPAMTHGNVVEVTSGDTPSVTVVIAGEKLSFRSSDLFYSFFNVVQTG